MWSARDTAEPGTDGDAREDRADDAGERLEADADVGCEQATGQDLEDEDRCRSAGHEHDRKPPGEWPARPSLAFLDRGFLDCLCRSRSKRVRAVLGRRPPNPEQVRRT